MKHVSFIETNARHSFETSHFNLIKKILRFSATSTEKIRKKTIDEY